MSTKSVEPTPTTDVESMNPYDACSQIAGELNAAIALLLGYKDDEIEDRDGWGLGVVVDILERCRDLAEAGRDDPDEDTDEGAGGDR